MMHPIPALSGTNRDNSPSVIGKFWGFRCGTWYKVKNPPRPKAQGGLSN